MKVGLVVPCYIDTFFSDVGIATLELLERLGVEVEYPFGQTCCGQPMANSGCEGDSRATEEHFVKLFSRFEYIVVPSGSCTHHIRNKFIAAEATPAREHVSTHTFDLVEFLHDILKVDTFPGASFPHRVALHNSCSAIRGIGMASMSERVHDPVFNKPKALLQKVTGVEVVDFDRHDECCGFGGTFAATEEAISSRMGYDKLEFISSAKPEYVISSDMSCLMHLQGCARRSGSPLKFLHIAQVLNGVSHGTS
jgi:L-lactate dehydrogenase complex protein LldE